MSCRLCHGTGVLPGRQDSRKGRIYRYLLGLRACPCGLLWKRESTPEIRDCPHCRLGDDCAHCGGEGYLVAGQPSSFPTGGLVTGTPLVDCGACLHDDTTICPRCASRRLLAEPLDEVLSACEHFGDDDPTVLSERRRAA